MDKTSKTRQSRRRALLDAIAREAGYKSWSAFETEVIHKREVISKKK